MREGHSSPLIKWCTIKMVGMKKQKQNEDPKLAFACRMIRELKQQLENLEHLLQSQTEATDVEKLIKRQQIPDGELASPALGRVIDGVFDGEQMVGEDGRKYVVPANYASKSKLVEGDFLRLMITDDGRFLFKQKGPIERARLVGALTQDEMTGEWRVVAGGTKYRVSSAAISFFHGEAGDEIVILVPAGMPSRWAAVENVIKAEQ